MNWFLIALIGPFLWSVSNHIDKYLLNKYFKDLGIGALIIFSSLIGIIILPIILIFKNSVFNLDLFQAVMIMIAGIILAFAWLTYLYALQEDEASIVASLFQTIPIFLYLLAFIFLNETLSLNQILGSLLIMSGGLAITWDINRKKFKAKIFWLMLLSSCLIACEAVIFKLFALETDFWTVSFWEYAGTLLIGFVFLITIPSYRKNFNLLWKRNKASLIGVNLFNEIINLVGTLSSRYAMLLVPIALVQSVNGFQPLIGILIGVALTIFFPYIGKENIVRKHLIQKIIAVIIMVAGAYLIESNT